MITSGLIPYNLISSSNIDGIVICFNDVHHLNALSPMKSTDFGIEIFSIDEQFENALKPIFSNACGNFIFSNDEQFLNELSSINTTDSGIIISVIEEHP